VPSALILDDAFDTAASAMFADGDATPMSASAQRIVPFLAPAPGERILDACAAPGGKAGHIISLVGSSADLTCVERDPRRARVLRENLDRVGAADARIVVADAASLPDELGRFDAILLDAPCSGLGVINSRPDLRWRRQPADIAVLAALQQQLIDALTTRLAPRGRLAYSVCTLLPAENEQQVAARTVRRQLRTWPPDGDDAGFYAALIEP
jgi:16S rRNA (cytosine967-C5)-methyltransferase